MEQLESLIRTLTYKRSCLELILKKPHSVIDQLEIKGEIAGITFAITEIYKLVNEQ